jgi:hypothetical protein
MPEPRTVAQKITVTRSFYEQQHTFIYTETREAMTYILPVSKDDLLGSSLTCSKFMNTPSTYVQQLTVILLIKMFCQIQTFITIITKVHSFIVSTALMCIQAQ